MGLQFLFMDDNAPCHRTVAAEQLLESEDIGYTYGLADTISGSQSHQALAFVEGWMVLLEMAVEAVDGLGTCVFCVDVDVTFRGQPLFRSEATGEVSMSLKGVKAEVW
ncbi:hypothetical protein TNCV_825931 [Trichonephila clavipes]|nr:hypothetical protein TNCV_825931 [Trichonephila clavipes]